MLDLSMKQSMWMIIDARRIRRSIRCTTLQTAIRYVDTYVRKTTYFLSDNVDPIESSDAG